MARRKIPPPQEDWLFPALSGSDADAQSSLLDVVDNVLNKGVVVNGDIVLGVANVDLIYLKLSALLAALDKVMDHEGTKARRKTRRKTQRRRRKA